MIQNSDRRLADHVAGPLHWKGGNRQAARKRFEQDQAEGVGLAGEHEHVRRGIDLRQRLAVLLAEEDRIGIGLFQRGARRAVADDHLGAG